jgi:hypothetical protein
MKSIIEATPLENNMLHVKFDDGKSFNVNINPFIKTGVSNALKDKQQFFNLVKVEDGYITWPNGYDFCPEFLYEYAEVVILSLIISPPFQYRSDPPRIMACCARC